MEYKKYFYDAVVVGSGAAGYNAICRLNGEGAKKAALVTESRLCGTSRNTGSDKQTYYKLGLGGEFPDSVAKMAHDLFSCGSVDGDNALCEAALSARCFMNLCELGVEFPVNRYGEYIGYKTDHDPYERATSAGPLTSKYMTEALERQALKNGAEIFDNMLAVEILKYDESVCGLLCLEKETGDFAVFFCTDIILATGGPAGIYADSVYPHGHTGSTGLALEAGAALQNMTEWQYGLASLNPRWNVSGTYMQVLPAIISVDSDGTEREFTGEYYGDIYKALSAKFLKGYQWPFDNRKAADGSSVIDLLVYRETVLFGRKVYLDYTKNPFGLEEIEFDRLSPEAYTYLEKAGACFGTPYGRLMKMNAPAVELYRNKGVDLSRERLEIALCAQHNNGGIAVDMWWQTCVPGLFAAGECAGTHGISRPGGSALNAGQAGSLRAAQYICAQNRLLPDRNELEAIAEKAVKKHSGFCKKALENTQDADTLTKKAARRMSDKGGAIRTKEEMDSALGEILDELAALENTAGVKDIKNLYKYYKLKDILTVQAAVLTAMSDFAEKMPFTRGSALYFSPDGVKAERLPECFRFVPDDGGSAGKIQEVSLKDGKFVTLWRRVRPIPENSDFFENVWRQYRENKNIY